MDAEPGHDHERSFLSGLRRHGVTATVALRFFVVVAMLIVVGVRFERVTIALAVSVAYLVMLLLLGRSRD